jgi:hypothetical protein
LAVLLAAPAASAQSPSQDSAAGSGPVFGRYGSNFTVPGDFILGGMLFDFTATSGARGESPTGQVDILFAGEFTVSRFVGPVTCLRVAGKRADIGFRVESSNAPNPAPGYFVTLVDGGPEGSGLDLITATSSTVAGPTDCSRAPDPPFSDPRFTVTEGDVVVTDAPGLPTSVRQCLNGGWSRFGFKSVGQCLKFVVLTHLCTALARRGHELPFCPPKPPA